MTRKKKHPGIEKHRKTASPPSEAGSPEVELPTQPEVSFPIVGIGASAGGLAALEEFFAEMPAETESGMAVVVVQHLAPDHKSILSELIKRYTKMRVFEVEDGMQVQPNCAYIIPPNCNLAILNGALQLLGPAAEDGPRLPIDYFFRSLAQDQHERAICIILSGTGSDGALGVRAIKGEGGIALVQNPDSTEFDGMPRSAIATGLVDFVSAPGEMPAQLIAYVRHAFKAHREQVSEPIPKIEDTLKKICVLLRDTMNHDFSQYKGNTLMRRVERRMAVHQIDRADDYLRFLQEDLVEVEALFRDLLIGVTSFFRDPEAFAVLEKKIIPGLFNSKPPEGELRVWVAGCSTGEEAYSIAILIQEHMDALKKPFKVQIFATDVDNRTISQARGAVFPASIAADVSPERLARFFIHDEQNGVYQVRNNIRDLLIFSEQDVIKDPPFSKLDLISCRNVLIYMNSELQKKIIPLFHYALNPDGFLFLGSSETVGEFSTHFTTLNRKWKIYQRHADIVGAPRLGNLVFPISDAKSKYRSLPIVRGGVHPGKPNLGDLTVQTLLQHCAQVGVLVDARGEILHIHGRTGRYLEPAPGNAGMNILNMAREGLRRELATALHRATANNEPVRYPGLQVKTNGDSVTVNLTVRPAVKDSTDSTVPELFLVIIEEAPAAIEPSDQAADNESGPQDTDANARFDVLERELRAKEEFLQSTLEELETSNEELRSANEEAQSVNEELQSTNEELETSKEELQSVNEELATVNAELQIKVSDLSRANNDMNNLLAGTGVGTLFVDHQLRITRFTPTTTQVINLIQSDLGRPIGDIVSNLVGYDSLVEDTQSVLESLIPAEVEVQTKWGEWHLLRIRPYRTLENVIEGAVITFVNITNRKLAEREVLESQELLSGIVATVREPLLVLTGELKVVLANEAFCQTFQVTQSDTVGKTVYELGNKQWDIAGLRTLLEEVLAVGDSFDNYEVVHDFESIGERRMLLNARRLGRSASHGELILLAMEDLTDRAQIN